KLFRDRNFVLGNTIGFVVFISLFSIMSLIPPFMQNLLDYPVVITGLVLMPRGIGTMLSMMVVGRMSSRIDPRINMSMGLAIMALSMYYMSHFDTGVDTWAITWTGFVQGLGMGQVMVPLMTMVFSTLPPEMRTEGTGIYNLVRNVGGSVGISVAFTLLSRNTQINHQVLAAHINVYNDAIQLSSATSQLNLHNPHDLAIINGMVTQQAAMISFNDDFKLMMILSLAAIPLVFMMRRPKYGPQPDKTQPALAME
ncbi:MAG: MFS transporter, partial [Gammaproteobacteria bacterium]|nr:MFS transporter [Gammaproteobacteria bacterium]